MYVQLSRIVLAMFSVFSSFASHSLVFLITTALCLSLQRALVDRCQRCTSPWSRMKFCPIDRRWGNGNNGASYWHKSGQLDVNCAFVITSHQFKNNKAVCFTHKNRSIFAIGDPKYVPNGIVSLQIDHGHSHARPILPFSPSISVCRACSFLYE